MTITQPDVFWGAVAQVVPVFALTLVLELRRIAPNWRIERKIQRRLESFVLLTAGLLLLWLFVDALSALIDGPAMRPKLAVILLTVAFGLLAVNPLWLGVVGANSDIVERTFRPLERRTTRARVGRKIEELRREVYEYHDQIGDRLGKLDLVVASTLALTRREELLTPDDLQDLHEMAAAASDESAPEVASLIREPLRQYESEPSLAIAARLMRVQYWVWLDYRSDLRSRKLEIERHIAGVEALRKDADIAALDGRRLQEATEAIADSGSGFIVNWPATSPRQAR